MSASIASLIYWIVFKPMEYTKYLTWGKLGCFIFRAIKSQAIGSKDDEFEPAGRMRLAGRVGTTH
jgi:hypothetical protein